MRPGKVATIRVRPQDCMSIVDWMDKVGISMRGISFAKAASLCLSSCLEALRQNGKLPTRDGFEYNQLMNRFPRDTIPERSKAAQISDALFRAGDIQVKPVIADPEQEKRHRRYMELKVMHADEINHPIPEPGTPEHTEWQDLILEFEFNMREESPEPKP